MTTTDMLPTIAGLTGQPAPTDRVIDGKNVSDILLGKPGAKSPHEMLYYENGGVRQGKWKLVHYRVKANWFTELYDLDADLGERNNIAAQHPERVRALKAALDAHVEAIEQNPRPAASVEDPGPLLANANGLPTLAEYVSGVRQVTGGSPEATKGNAQPIAASVPNNQPSRVARGRPNRIYVTPVKYTPAEDDILIADFEGEDYGDWQIIGEAFGEGPSRRETHRNRACGHLGKGFVNSYLNGDKATGELVSPPFKIERKHISFLIGGGRHPGRTGIQLQVDGKTVRQATGLSLKNPKNQEIMDWRSLDVAEFIGKQAVLKIVDKHSGGWGHTVVDHIIQSNKAMPSSLPQGTAAAGPAPSSGQENSAGFVPPPIPGVTLKDEWSTFPLYSAVGYDQPLCPQFHFTSRMGWLNDTNGMVYYDGEWHMMFQHHAKGNAIRAKSWGNAVSTDLMHWTQLPHAINPYPDVKREGGNIHAIWSGSAVVDELNALGKQKGETKTLYAIYTATHAGEDGKAAFSQAAAYSTDKGRKWTKINGGRPIIDHQAGRAGGQRDPRIFYYAPDRCYVVIMMVGGKDRAVRLWKSTDLLHWEVLGHIPNKAAECIDMYHVAVDGDPTKRKWVISNAGTHYEVGDFDGKTWRGSGAKDQDDRPLRFDYGDAYYAAQVFNQAPEGRVVHIGWLRSKHPGYRPFLEAGMPFTQQLSIPAEITLRTTPQGIRMHRNPVREIESLYARTTKLANLPLKEANAKLANLAPELIDLTVSFRPKGDCAVIVRGLSIRYSAGKQEFQFVNKARVEGERAGMAKLAKARRRPYRDTGVRAIPAPTVNGKVTLRALVDRASLELFVNDGQAAASFVVVPAAENRRIAIEGDDALEVDSLIVNELKSTW